MGVFSFSYLTSSFGRFTILNSELLIGISFEMKTFREALYKSVYYSDITKFCDKIVQWVLKNDPSYVRYVGFNRVEGFDIQYTKKQRGKQTVLKFFYEIECEDGEKVKVDFLTIVVNPYGIVYEVKSKIVISTREDNIKRHARFANDLYRFCGNLVLEQEADFDFDYKMSGSEYPHVREFYFKVDKSED